MRTRIRADWVTGFREGRHTLIPQGELVWEADRILFVGRDFPGRVDHEINAGPMLLAPGFIDCHVHAGYQIPHRLMSDHGRPDNLGQPFPELEVSRKGTRNPLHDDPDDPWPLFTVAELLRNGVTSFVEVGAPVAMQTRMAGAVGQLGLRAWLGASYDMGGWTTGEGGMLERVIDPAHGAARMQAAAEFSRRINGGQNGRLSAILAPSRIDSCSVEQLRETARLAGETAMPVSIHAASHVHEYYDILRRYRMTPIELLRETGLLDLGPLLTIGHGNFTSDHPQIVNSHGARDVALLGSCGCSVSHCPVNLARRGRILADWPGYARAGVNLTLGADTYPRDMIHQMRKASLMGKMVSGDLTTASAAEVFTAATLNGARALGRDDLGALEPGRKADLVLIRLAPDGVLRQSPLRDPIRAVVECGQGDDVDTVVVDGVIRMQGGRIPGLDLADLARAAQAKAEWIWQNWQDWDTLGRRAEEVCPPSFELE
ncbi:chlorohydrolase family protein [Pseudomonas sp. GX19020]|uniref:chlorohydrolase family protein n=1 Tax=Pseudomonas sp. GX19020 TaxID=2942277 RepID=UPI0020199D47|nr:chlorohydrolase family protein [Pseudomonas sp. GX19020]MCL4069423.1 chlorohydrolase family protein [Pseudomonas sp. GX19020]